jgi:hypothetical protein
MSNTDSKFMEVDLQATYSDAALAKAHSRYSFKYKIDGTAYTVSYDPQKGELLSCDEHGELFDLAQEIEHVITELKHDFDIFDVRRFLCKHLQAMIKVGQELQHAPASERRYEVLNSKPVDMENFSLEGQCVLEVLQEQVEKAVDGGAVGDGVPSDVTYTATKEMVEAKMREKTQKQN